MLKTSSIGAGLMAAGLAVTACSQQSTMEGVAEVVGGNCGLFLAMELPGGTWLTAPGDPESDGLQAGQLLDATVKPETGKEMGILLGPGIEIEAYRFPEDSVIPLDGCFDLGPEDGLSTPRDSDESDG